ncbi:hypothetical protein [Micromonospora sp. NPDC047074]|uniref:hypothetical protein n=1 Tax=Micromonospora sp. NPDC047074 TaxID=3154339 RepID=UPI0033E2E157
MGETGQTDPATASPGRPDQWHDFRRGIALLSMVLFFFCVVGLGFLVHRLATSGGDGVFDGWSFFRFLSVAVPLGVAAAMGLGVYRAPGGTEARRRGRVMGLALLVAVVLLVVTGVVGDRLS